MFCSLKQHIFFTALLWLVPWALHFKVDLYGLRRCSYNILNHSKWRTIEKDLPKCLVIGKQLVMGWFILCCANMIKYVKFILWPTNNWWKIDWVHHFPLTAWLQASLHNLIAQRKPYYYCCTLTCTPRPYHIAYITYMAKRPTTNVGACSLWSLDYQPRLEGLICNPKSKSI